MRREEIEMGKDLHYIAPKQMALYQAAPELLEACKAVQIVLLQTKRDEKIEECLSLLGIAIAKAEGKES